MDRSNERRIATGLLVVTAVLWSLGGLLIKMVEASPLAIAGARSLIAAVVLLLFMGMPKLNWSVAQVCAAMAYSATTILFVIATKLTAAANAILLQFTAPIYVALLAAWLLKEKTRFRDWVMIFAVVAGMSLFFFDGLGAGEGAGNLVAAASGVSFALFIVLMRMQKDGSPLGSVFLGNIATGAVGLPLLLTASPVASGWLYIAVLGVFQLGIPYILFSRAIKHATALEAALIPMLEPILNPVWVFLLLGEFPPPLALMGGTIVLTAVAVRCLWSAMPGQGGKTETEPRKA